MPELPEVESYRRLADGALGRRIAKVHTPDAWFLKEGTSPAALTSVLVGHRLTAARRIGKLLLLDTDGGPVLGVRFGMTGTLVVDGVRGVDRLQHAPTRSDPAWDRFTVGFEDGGTLAVHDPRRLGGVMLDPAISRLGPDAATLDIRELSAMLVGSSTPLKARLLDQSRVAGIGNLMGDEVLWRAGLSPHRPAGSLSGSEVRRLHRALRGTLDDLLQRGGSHLGDVIAERHTGGRCPKDGVELARATVGGRTTWWCPGHQR